MNTRTVQDALDIMRTGLGRQNGNDPASSDATFLRYLNNFVTIKKSNDVKLVEQYGTLKFTIDETNPSGVYTFNEVGASFDFVNISMMGFISLTDPVNNSVSWNQLSIYQDPGEFYSIWGINNQEILIPGYPTMMLYYGNEFVFRTIPQTSYTIEIYGYRQDNDFEDFDQDLEFYYQLRYIAYGAMVDYCRDYRMEPSTVARIEKTFASERKSMLTRTHNQVKLSRALPRF